MALIKFNLDFLQVMVIPNLHCPICATRDEDLWMEMIPFDRVDRHVVSLGRKWTQLRREKLVVWRKKREEKPTRKGQRLEWMKNSRSLKSNEQNQMLSTCSRILRSFENDTQITGKRALKVWFCDTVVEKLHKSVRMYGGWQTINILGSLKFACSNLVQVPLFVWKVALVFKNVWTCFCELKKIPLGEWSIKTVFFIISGNTSRFIHRIWLSSLNT